MANDKEKHTPPDRAGDGHAAQSSEHGGHNALHGELKIKRVFEPDNERMVAALLRVLSYHVSHDHTADVIGKPSAAFAYERADAYPAAKANDVGEAAATAQSPVTHSGLESNLSTERTTISPSYQQDGRIEKC